MSALKDFKPSILFLAKFIGIYVVLNIAYGFYLEAYRDKADPMTELVTAHTAAVLSLYENNIHIGPKADLKSVYIYKGDRAVLSVYEGCNGLNVMIIFLAFIIAYSKLNRKMLWFIPMGFLVIHLFNILRIDLLFHVTISLPNILYFSHKYLFTAFIYLAVFLLWAVWVLKINTTVTDVESKQK